MVCVSQLPPPEGLHSPVNRFPARPACGRNAPVALFHEMFGARLDKEEDYMAFFANRHTGKDTFLRADIDKAGKLATAVVEEYGVRASSGDR